MASAIKVASTSRWSSSPVVQSSPAPLPKRVAAAAAMPGRRRSVGTIRAVAAVAPAAPATPAKLTGAGGRCLTVSQTMSRLRAQGKVRMYYMHVASIGLRVPYVRILTWSSGVPCP
jgi:indole-3-glycerol-phosphate lyase